MHWQACGSQPPYKCSKIDPKLMLRYEEGMRQYFYPNGQSVTRKGDCYNSFCFIQIRPTLCFGVFVFLEYIAQWSKSAQNMIKMDLKCIFSSWIFPSIFNIFSRYILVYQIYWNTKKIYFHLYIVFIHHYKATETV